MTWIVIPLVLAVVAILPLIAKSILGPVSRAAGALKAPTRFQLSDFVWLLVLLQVALGATLQLIGAETRVLFEMFLVYLVFAVIGIWIGAISFLSRAAITDPWRRAAFILLVMPGTLGVMVCLPSAAHRVWDSSLMPFASALRFGYLDSRNLAVLITQVVSVLVITPLVVWALRRAAAWVAEGSQLQNAHSKPRVRWR